MPGRGRTESGLNDHRGRHETVTGSALPFFHTERFFISVANTHSVRQRNPDRWQIGAIGLRKSRTFRSWFRVKRRSGDRLHGFCLPRSLLGPHCKADPLNKAPDQPVPEV